MLNATNMIIDGDIDNGSDDSMMATEERNLSWYGAKASLT